MLELAGWCLENGEEVVAELCALKYQATRTLAFFASEAL
jgi:acyl-CoA dehydrogenase